MTNRHRNRFQLHISILHKYLYMWKFYACIWNHLNHYCNYIFLGKIRTAIEFRHICNAWYTFPPYNIRATYILPCREKFSAIRNTMPCLWWWWKCCRKCSPYCVFLPHSASARTCVARWVCVCVQSREYARKGRRCAKTILVSQSYVSILFVTRKWF